jgi:M3 family oligoendopeptidase
MKTRLRLMTSKDIDIIESAMADFQKQLSRFYTAEALCRIRHDQNTSNPFYLNELTYFEESEPAVSELSAAVYSMLLNSEIKELLREKFGDMLFRKALTRKETVSGEVIDNLIQESELENKYDQELSEANIHFNGKKYNLSMMDPFLESSDRDERRLAHEAVSEYYSGNLDFFNGIFDSLVKTRTSIAQKLTYPSFVSLGYKRMERYDYTPEMVSEFRDNVVRYIVPLTVEIRRLQSDRLGISDLKYFDLPVMFSGGNPKPIIEKTAYHLNASKMFKSIFEKDPSFFDVLQTYGFTDLVSRKGKSTGGYCSTLLDYGVPFIFMNASGTSDDVATLIHESGHAYAAIRSADCSPFIECLSPTLETCEIHSTAMEYLSYPYLELFFGEKASVYRDLHLTLALLFIPYGCMVDEFQHIIYSNPSMSHEERHKEWHDLEKKYQPYLDYDENDFYESGAAWIKKGHIFTDPFYYIDYCLAQVVSLQIWDISRSQPQKAFTIYDQLCLEGGNKMFLELLEKVGLESPFSVGAIKRSAYRVAEFLAL